MKLKAILLAIFEKRKFLIKSYAAIILFGVLLIIVRKLLHYRQGYSLLLWNFFLAMIPLLISSCMVEMNRLKYKNSSLFILGFFWLLFLPNAPYMLSDYKYIWFDSESHINMNILTLSWFIIPAILTAVISVNDISNILSTKFNIKTVNAGIFLICIMAGFGVYIGNHLRFNSWDILHQPLSLVREIGGTFIHPIQNKEAWVVTIGYGMVLFLAFRVVKLISGQFR